MLQRVPQIMSSSSARGVCEVQKVGCRLLAPFSVLDGHPETRSFQNWFWRKGVCLPLDRLEAEGEKQCSDPVARRPGGPAPRERPRA